MAGVAAAFAVVIVTPLTVSAINGFAAAEGLTKNVEMTTKPVSIEVSFFLNIVPHSATRLLWKIYNSWGEFWGGRERVKVNCDLDTE